MSDTVKKPFNPMDELETQAIAMETLSGPQPGNEGGGVDEDEIQIGNAKVIAGAIGAAREVFCFFTKLESPRRVMDNNTVENLGQLWGPVADKHEFNLNEMMGDYALEFAAIMGTIAILSQVAAAVRAEIAAKTVDEEKPATPARETAEH